jgi:hypothetical protein
VTFMMGEERDEEVEVMEDCLRIRVVQFEYGLCSYIYQSHLHLVPE